MGMIFISRLEITLDRMCVYLDVLATQSHPEQERLPVWITATRSLSMIHPIWNILRSRQFPPPSSPSIPPDYRYDCHCNDFVQIMSYLRLLPCIRYTAETFFHHTVYLVCSIRHPSLWIALMRFAPFISALSSFPAHARRAFRSGRSPAARRPARRRSRGACSPAARASRPRCSGFRRCCTPGCATP